MFTLEYLLRIVVAEHRFKFIASPFGIVDLAAILPFYVTTGVDLRPLRAVRLFRLFDMLNLVRYSKAIQTFRQALRLAKEELLLLLSFSLLLLFSQVWEFTTLKTSHKQVYLPRFFIHSGGH